MKLDAFTLTFKHNGIISTMSHKPPQLKNKNKIILGIDAYCPLIVGNKNPFAMLHVKHTAELLATFKMKCMICFLAYSRASKAK